MRILIVSQYYPPEPFRIGDLAAWLAARGHAVSALTGQPNYPEGRLYAGYGPIRPMHETIDGVSVHRVPLLPRGRAGALRLSANYLSFAFTGTCLGPLLARARVDAVLCYLISPMTAAFPGIMMSRLRRAPLVLWVQDIWPESVAAAGKVESRAVLGALDRMVGFVYRRADAIWIPSRAFASAVTRYGIAPGRIVYVPNSSESLYRPTGPARPGAPDRLSILYAGNIGEAQGFETILAAIELTATVPGIEWIFAGDGRRRAWLAAELERRRLGRARIVDRVPAEQMPALIVSADALLVPLRRAPVFAMTVPSKLQSSLASGRPVLAALEGEGARLVEEAGAGLVVPPDDPQALAEAAIRMASLGPEARQRMGVAGRRYFDLHFEREHVYARIEQNLSAVAQRGHGRT